MKRKFTLHLFLLIIVMTTGIFSSSAQTVTTTIYYYGAQSNGCCNVCGGDYWCINNTGGCGTPSSCDTKYFTDPVPAGNIVTSVDYVVFSAGNGQMLTTTTNGIGSSTFWEPYDGNLCGNCSMGVNSTGPTTYPCGMPGYVYGGSNAMQLCTGVDVCVARVEATITYTSSTGAIPPTSASVDHPSFCTGDYPTITLTAFGGSGTTLNWYSGSCGGTFEGSGSPLTITAPSSTTTYYALWTSSCGTSSCVSTTVTITTGTVAPTSASVDHPSFCPGDYPTITLTALGGSGTTLNWYSGSCGGTLVGTGSPLTISAPSSTTTYYAAWNAACGTSSCINTTVTINSTATAPTSASVDHPSFCIGDFPTITLTAPGGSGTSLNWYSGSCGGTLVGTGSPLTITAPSATTTYYAQWTSGCGNSGCTSTTVTINPPPVAPATASVDNTSFCAGAFSTITLTAIGGSGTTLNWYAGSCGGTLVGTGSPLTITAPSSTTTYYAAWTAICGTSSCVSTTVTINPLPIAPASAAVDNASFCAGAFSTITLTAIGGSGTTLNWYTGSCGGTPAGSGTPLTITTPLTSTTYYASWTNSCGTTSCASVNVNIYPIPLVNAGPDVTIPNGAWTTLYGSAIGGSGSYSYNWSPSGLLNNSSLQNPTTTSLSATTTYTLTVTDLVSGCSGTDDVIVIITGPPLSAIASSNPTSVCGGNSVQLFCNALGGANVYTYSWSSNPPGFTSTIQNPVLIPTTTTTYTVTVNDGYNNVTASVTVTVYPQIIANAGADVSICNGGSTTLNASGGTIYSWSPAFGLNATNIANPIASPSATTTYIVTVSDVNGCSATDNVVVSLYYTIPANAGVDQNICSGQSAYLNGSGGVSFNWSPSTGLNSTIVPNPTATPLSTTIYTLVTTDGNGCTSSDNVVVTVNPNVIAYAGPDVSVCSGNSTTLSASGGSIYAWSPSYGLNLTNGASPVASPMFTTTYTVTVSNSFGCSGTDNVIVTVNPSIVAYAGPDVSICSGNSTTLNATGGTIYSWSPNTGLSATNISNPVANPVSTITYTVIVSDMTGCSGSDNITVSVNQTPLADAGISPTICNHQAAVLTASGGTNYMWNNGVNTAINTVWPNASTTYTVTVSNSSGCFATDMVTVTVLPYDPPVITANGPLLFCNGSQVNVTLDAGTGYSTYLWNSGQWTQTINVTTAGTYYVIGTTANGCSDTSNVVNVINPPPMAPPVIVADGTTDFCEGQHITVNLATAIPYYTYTWTSGSHTQQIHVMAAGTYQVTVTDANGCTGVSNTITVNFIPKPVAYMNYNASGTYASFFNYSLNDMSYHWDFGDGGTSLQENPTHGYATPGVYLVTFVVYNTCGTDTVKVWITIVSGAGIDEWSAIENLLVYPIPTDDELVVSFDAGNSKGLEVKMLNTLGQALYDEKTEGVAGKYERTFSLRGWAKGMYYLQIQSDKGVVNRKFIVN